ncbi:DUF5082 family protein [Bacillus sp. FSL W7-1360]
MNDSVKISQLNSEIDSLTSVVSETTLVSEELLEIRQSLSKKKDDLENDNKWIHEPEIENEISRGTISSTHDGERNLIERTYKETPEQVQDMMDAITEERSRLQREINRNNTIIASKKNSITTLLNFRTSNPACKP